MTPRKPTFIVIRPKKFFKQKELVSILNMDEKHILKNAILCGALYRIGGKKLINLEIMLQFLEKVGNLAEEIDGRYCQVSTAAAYLGVETDQVMQIASDADALLKLREILLIDMNALKKYIVKFGHKVELFDVDEIELMAKIERRRQYYV